VRYEEEEEEARNGGKGKELKDGKRGEGEEWQHCWKWHCKCICSCNAMHSGHCWISCRRRGQAGNPSSWTDSGTPARTARRGRKGWREKFRESGRNKGESPKRGIGKGEFPRGFGKRGIETFVATLWLRCVCKASSAVKKNNCHQPVEPPM
jgi:hypothetical protein